MMEGIYFIQWFPMKLFWIKVLLVVVMMGSFSSCLAQQSSWGSYGNNPLDILDTVAWEANDQYKIQETKLNEVSNLEGGFPSQFRITNTLDSIRAKITPYIQWIMFIWLSLAVVLIIYNGLLLVTNSLHGDGEISSVQKRIINILIWVLVLTGFYFILQVTLSLIANVTT